MAKWSGLSARFPTVSLALRNVLRHGRRSAIAIGAIAFGTAALLLAGGFIEWIFVNFREYSIHSHLGHIQIVRPQSESGSSDDRRDAMLPLDSPELHAIAARPDVQLVDARVSFSGLASSGETTLSFIGEGVDPVKDREFSSSMTISAGEPLEPGDGDGIIVGEGLAANLGVVPGSKLVLLATLATGGISAVEVHVRGIFYTVTKAYDDVALRVPTSVATRLTKLDAADRWIVLLKHTDETPAALSSLRQALAGKPLLVRPWWELADFYNRTVKLFSRQLDVMRLIVGIIIVLGISNTMIMNVLERTWEIGTCMALGTSRRSILAQFVLEGTLLGALGGLCGLAGGGLLATAISAIGIPMPPPPGMQHGFEGGILVTLPLAAGALALAVSTALAASLYPARKASRLNIVDALRHGR
jgi:putative ABC transport system permease protein